MWALLRCDHQVGLSSIIASNYLRLRGIVMLDSAISNSFKCTRQYYTDLSSIIFAPSTQNSMTRDVFEFMGRYFYEKGAWKRPVPL